MVIPPPAAQSRRRNRASATREALSIGATARPRKARGPSYRAAYDHPAVATPCLPLTVSRSDLPTGHLETRASHQVDAAGAHHFLSKRPRPRDLPAGWLKPPEFSQMEQ